MRSRVWQLEAHRPTTKQGVRVVNDWQVCCGSPPGSVHARSARNSAANSIWSREAVQETGRLSVGSCAVSTHGPISAWDDWSGWSSCWPTPEAWSTTPRPMAVASSTCLPQPRHGDPQPFSLPPDLLATSGSYC